MDCPILVWMLSLNRDTDTEVRTKILSCPTYLRAHVLLFKEYEQCYNLVKECAPHTAIAHAPTDIDSFRGFCLQAYTCSSAYFRATTVNRTNNHGNVTTAYDEASTDLPYEVARLRNSFRETLDRTGQRGHHARYSISVLTVFFIFQVIG